MVASAQPRGGGLSRRSAVWVVGLALAAVVFALVVAPLANVFNISIHAETDLGISELRSFEAVISVYTTDEYLSPLVHALVLAVVVTAISLVLGVGMSLIVARTDVRFKPVWDVLIMVPLFLSPFTLLLAWITLAGSRTGFLNGIGAAIMRPWVPRPFDVVNIDSYGGIVWVLVLISCPLAYLFTIGTLRSMDASLEEASRSVGAAPLRTIATVTLPICLPSILSAVLLIFVLTLETYTIPGIIGSAIGFTTLPWKIFEDATNVPPRMAHAAAAGTLLLIITVLGIVVQKRITRFSSRYVTVSGKGIRARPFKLGKYHGLVLALLAAYIVAAAILPMVALFISSLLRFTAPVPTLSIMSLANYHQFFTEPATFVALPNTIGLALGAAILCVGIGLPISVLELRVGRWWTKAIASVGVLPVAVPGLIFGIGLLWVYISTPLYGTIWILLLAYVARFLPYGIVVSRAAILQIDKSLEESARMSGAGNLRILMTITAPLVKQTLIAIMFLVMLQSVKEISASILLFTPQSQVLSTLTWQYVASGDFQFAAMVGVIQTAMLIALVVMTRFLFGLRLERAMGKELA